MTTAFKRTLIGMLLAGLVAAAGADGAAGWRTDWTGRYPDADPPLEWATNKNVLWTVPLTSWANATPVVVGKKVLVTAEPLTLMCLDADTGQMLWQATNHVYESLLTSNELAEMKAKLGPAKQEWNAARAKEGNLKKELGEAKKKAQANTNDAAAQAALATCQQALKDQEAVVKAAADAVSRYGIPDRNNMTGWACCTPVSDGRHVWMVFGNGVVACYDLDGKRQWAVVAEKQQDGQGQSSSPLLLGDVLVVYVNNLIALDKKTGKQRWLLPCDYTHVFGSPVPARIGDTDVVITPGGEVVRASDGRELARHKYNQFNSLVAGGGWYYLVMDGQARGLRLPAAIENNSAIVTQIWKSAAPGCRHYASPVCHDSVLYGISEVCTLVALEAGTGKQFYEQKLDMKQAGKRPTIYPSPVVAGNVLLVSADNGITLVLQPGPEFKELGRNTLEPFRSTPVPAGKRLYIRTLKNMYCLGK